MGIWWQITLSKIKFYKACEWLCQNTGWKILFTKFEGCSLVRTCWINFSNFPYNVNWQGRRSGMGEKLQTNVWKFRKINWASSIQPTFFKLGKYNLLHSILMLWFINCLKFNFGKSYLPVDSHTNTVISDHFAYPPRWRRKTW